MKELDNKYIVQCHSLKKHPFKKEFYLVLERCDVPTLESHLKKMKKLSETFVQVLAKQLILALVYLKSKMVLHRDLHPKNIMCDKSNFAFLISRRASAQAY